MTQRAGCGSELVLGIYRLRFVQQLHPARQHNNTLSSYLYKDNRAGACWANESFVM
jgi:hypothetical protein